MQMSKVPIISGYVKMAATNLFSSRASFQADSFPLMMLTPQIKKENKFNFKEVFVSALKSLIQIK
jgi:hypothetical protein